MNLRYFVYKFWYLVWFVLIPFVVSWVVIYLLDRFEVVDHLLNQKKEVAYEFEFEPWYVLAFFAVLVVVVYSLRARLPFWQDKDPDSRFNRSHRAKAAAHLLKRVKKILEKKGYKVSDRGRTELHTTIGSLKKALDSEDHDRISNLAQKLEDKSNRHMPFARKSAAREYFESIGVAVLVAVFLRLFAVEAFKIPSESMVPTLMVGDHIFVSKYLYGISLPFTNKRLVRFADPSHGEVVVFVKPSLQEQTGSTVGAPLPDFLDDYEMIGKDFIKRIVALPGDTVEMRQDVLFINEKEIPRCRVGTRTYRSRNRDNWEDHEGDLWVEKHGEYLYTIVEDTDEQKKDDPANRSIEDFGPIQVRDDQVFVLGDNRDNSNDSRYWGSVPFDNIKGRAGMIWWSNRRPHGFQWDRFGDFIMHVPELTDDQQAALDKCAMKGLIVK